MSTNIKLTSPKLAIVTGDPDDDSTWEEFEVQTIGRDSIMAETLGGVQKWGRVQDHSMRYLSAMGYYAMMRRGAFSGSYEDFENATIEIRPVGADNAFPTVTGPEPD